MLASTDQDTSIVGCQFQTLTAPGPGAVAVIQLTAGGERTAVWLRNKIAAGSSANQTAATDRGMSIGRIFYGRWDGEDLIVLRTSEHAFEIQCHGGRIAINRIRHDLLTAGAIEDLTDSRQNSPELRDQIQREVELRLSTARSRKIAGLLLAQTTNSLGDDLTLLKSDDADPATVAEVTLRLHRWKNVADHLSQPWRVVLAGAPNVGKSSLMNAIAGMERSIVYDQPGTTRDIVEVDTVIDGWPFRFVDTAGIRSEDDADQIESLAIQQTYLAASNCDVLCLVIDERQEAQSSIERLMSSNLPLHTVVVRNKSDLPLNSETLQTVVSPFAAFPRINVSAATGHGLEELLHWIKAAMVPEEPTRETAIPILPI